MVPVHRGPPPICAAAITLIYDFAVAAPPSSGSDQHRASARTRWIVGAVIGALLLTLVAVGVAWNILSCDTPPCTGVTPQQIASANAENAARVASYSGPPPAQCGHETVPVHPRVAGTIWDEGDADLGRAPVWLTMNGLKVEGGQAVLHMEHLPIHKEAGGFPIYVDWITNADFTDVIHVRITDLQSGDEVVSQPAVYMHDPDLLVPAETKAVDVGATPPYRIFATLATFPTSPGCYTAIASWSGDSWSVPIAIGR